MPASFGPAKRDRHLRAGGPAPWAATTTGWPSRLLRGGRRRLPTHARESAALRYAQDAACASRRCSTTARSSWPASRPRHRDSRRGRCHALALGRAARHARDGRGNRHRRTAWYTAAPRTATASTSSPRAHRRADVAATSSEVARVCLEGGKVMLSYDERWAVFHHYIEKERRRGARLHGPDRPGVRAVPRAGWRNLYLRRPADR